MRRTVEWMPSAPTSTSARCGLRSRIVLRPAHRGPQASEAMAAMRAIQGHSAATSVLRMW